MAAAKKMDELLVTFLSNDATYESIMGLIETYQAVAAESQQQLVLDPEQHGGGVDLTKQQSHTTMLTSDSDSSSASPRGVIPPFYPTSSSDMQGSSSRLRRRTLPPPYELWEAPFSAEQFTADRMNIESVRSMDTNNNMEIDATATNNSNSISPPMICLRDLVRAVFQELGVDPPMISPVSANNGEDNNGTLLVTNSSMDSTVSMSLSRKYLLPEHFVRITKDICRLPSFFNLPLYQRILFLWNSQKSNQAPMEIVTLEMLEWFYKTEMEPYDMVDRFFRLVKQPDHRSIERNDFLPYIKALLSDHPGLEFLSSHAEFQEKYAITVVARIFYSVNTCHSGRITSRQLRRSDLLEAFQQVDEEEDINKVTRYFSYEHFYVLYCRFWELDSDRDYRIHKDDLQKYADSSLSHMIVDRVFDAAPRPFETEASDREFMAYEAFIYFMLSEEDKSNEVSVRYWFACVDVDGDGKLNNMEMRAFYAVQLNRMHSMGQDVVPFEDMLCQMVDMIKPANPDYFVVEDFLQPECCHLSGALFDALFNLNKYMLFEQRDPFAERQKREDEFDCDWDRFACIDYNRLAMEEEAREEEAMEIDWITVDESENGGGAGQAGENPPF